MTAVHHTPRIAVVGGSVAGLSAALFLARRGHPVVVLERDGEPAPGAADGAGAWRRRSTPQSAHSHAFLARSRAILAREAPDVLADLVAAGVRQARLVDERPPALEGWAPADGDDDLVVLHARRSVFEWVLRRAVMTEPGIDLRTGVTVTGLDGRTNGVRRVVGVATDAGSVRADVVVDAAGTRSPVRGWVGNGDRAGEGSARDVPCGVSYLTRFYRLHDDEPVRLDHGVTHGATFDRYSCRVFPADNGTFSITFGVLPEDRDTRVLLHPAAFDAAAAAIPAIAPWVDEEVAEPTSDVALMASLRNVLQPPGNGEPLGLHAIGDARCVTNPAHARGTTLALLAAQRLAEAITEHPTDADAQAEVMASFTAVELAGWVEDSIARDAARLVRWRPGEEPEPSRTTTVVTHGEAYLAGQRDARAWRAFTRLQHALARPDEVLDDVGVAAALARVRTSGWQPTPAAAPDHDELVARARAAAAAGPAGRSSAVRFGSVRTPATAGSAAAGSASAGSASAA